MKKLYGIAVAMVTPFTADDKIDVEALKANAEMLIQKGVNCLYPCGTTGEMLRLTVEERKLIVETVLKQAAGRVVVYAHVGAATTKETIELAKHAEKIGCDGIGVVSPQFFKANDREMEEYYAEVAASVSEDFPIYMYNIPVNSGNDISVAAAEKIARRCKNVIGIKYSYPDIKRTIEYNMVNDGKLCLMHGTDRILAAIYAVGCDGTISANSAVFPEIGVELYKACVAGDRAAMQKWTAASCTVSDMLKGGASIPHYKAALELRGMPGGCNRKPCLDITEEEKQILHEKMLKVCEKYNIPLKLA